MVRTRRASSGIIAATVAGNALEFFDFVTYAFFAVYIGRAFFPASSPMSSLLWTVAVFGVGFVTRPIGGILIGALADRAGRRPALMLTIALITTGTLGIAVTPSYERIGIAAPLIVVSCRLIQGLALGGEVGPATAFLIESAPRGRRGVYGSWQSASQGAAIFAAGLMGFALTRSLAPADLLAWGWRVPFLFGLLLVPIAFYLRSAMQETLFTRTSRDAPARMRDLKDHAGLLVLTILAILGGTVSTYVSLYMTTYAVTTLKLPGTIAMTATIVVGLVTMVFALASGWACDRFGRKPTMLLPRIAAAVLTVPTFSLLIGSPSPGRLLATSAVLALLTALSGAATIIAIPEMFPRRLRATGMAIAYAMGVSLFGGTTQYIVTWLISVTGNPASPAWYVAATSAVSVLAILALPETREGLPEDLAVAGHGGR